MSNLEQELRAALREMAHAVDRTPDFVTRAKRAVVARRRRTTAAAVSSAFVATGLTAAAAVSFSRFGDEQVQPGGASGGPSAASPSSTPEDARPCGHSVPATLEGFTSEAAGDDAAVLIDEIVGSGVGFADGRPASGLPVGLENGVIGVVGDTRSGFVIVVDAAVVNIPAIADRLTDELPPESAARVTVEASCVSSTELATAWRRLSQLDWHPTATEVTLAFDLDPSQEQIVVNISESDAANGVREAIESIAPALIHFEFVTLERSGPR